MIRFVKHFIVIFFIITPASLFGKSAYSEKKVHLTAGQLSLNALLKNISAQTTCVFSYDPVMINDKQMITVLSNLNCTLNEALRKTLPKNIQFRFKDKFIVLQRVSTVVKETIEKKVIVPSTPKPTAKQVIPKATVVIDSSQLVPIFVENTTVAHLDTAVQIPIVDTVVAVLQQETVIAKELPPVPQSSPIVKRNSPGFGQFIKDNAVIEIELAAYSKKLAGAVHLGLYGFYAILSIGTNVEKARSSGIGAGASFKVAKHLGLNLEVLRLDLLSGITYNLGVRTVTTQFRPELNYYLGKSIKLFVGTTFNMLNSKYVNSIKTYDLGQVFYYGGIIGIKVDINNLLSKNS